MKEKSLQVSWDWSKVEDFTYWKIPDGYVMSLPYYIGKPPAKIFDLGCGVGRQMKPLKAHKNGSKRMD